MASKKDNLPVNIQEEQEQGSSITYAPEVLNIITLTAVNEVEGIAGLSNANGSLLRKGNTAKGIRIEQSPEEVSVELFLVVEYDRPIQKVAAEVQENVRKTIEGMTGMHVVRVDVHITGVSFEKENTVSASAAKKAKLKSDNAEPQMKISEITIEDGENDKK